MGKSAGSEGERTVSENGPQPAALASTFRPVPFSLTLAPGVQIRASRDGLNANFGRRTPRIYVGQQFANPAIPTAPLTFTHPAERIGDSRHIWRHSYRRQPTKRSRRRRWRRRSRAFARCTTRTYRQSRDWSFRTRPARDHAAILRRRMNDALARVSIFRRSTRKAATAAAVLATRMECNELEAANQAQCVAIQQEIDQLWQRLIINNPDVLFTVLSHTFQNGSVHAAPLGIWDTEAQLALLVPDLAVLPERHPTTTAAGNLSLKKFTKGEMADLYKQLVAGLVLKTAKEALAVAPGVTDIRIVALRSTPADAYGKVRPEAMLATRIARPALNGVQWTKADALTILDQINSEIVTRTAGPKKAFASLDLKTEPEIAHLIRVLTSGG